MDVEDFCVDIENWLFEPGTKKYIDDKLSELIFSQWNELVDKEETVNTLFRGWTAAIVGRIIDELCSDAAKWAADIDHLNLSVGPVTFALLGDIILIVDFRRPPAYDI